MPSGDHESDYGDNIPRDVTLDEISLARSGDDLVLIGPEFSNISETTVHSTMTIDDFFTRGLTSITIDGVAISTIGL